MTERLILSLGTDGKADKLLDLVAKKSNIEVSLKYENEALAQKLIGLDGKTLNLTVNIKTTGFEKLDKLHSLIKKPLDLTVNLKGIEQATEKLSKLKSQISEVQKTGIGRGNEFMFRTAQAKQSARAVAQYLNLIDAPAQGLATTPQARASAQSALNFYGKPSVAPALPANLRGQPLTAASQGLPVRPSVSPPVPPLPPVGGSSSGGGGVPPIPPGGNRGPIPSAINPNLRLIVEETNRIRAGLGAGTNANVSQADFRAAVNFARTNQSGPSNLNIASREILRHYNEAFTDEIIKQGQNLLKDIGKNLASPQAISQVKQGLAQASQGQGFKADAAKQLASEIDSRVAGNARKFANLQQNIHEAREGLLDPHFESELIQKRFLRNLGFKVPTEDQLLKERQLKVGKRHGLDLTQIDNLVPLPNKKDIKTFSLDRILKDPAASQQVIFGGLFGGFTGLAGATLGGAAGGAGGAFLGSALAQGAVGLIEKLFGTITGGLERAAEAGLTFQKSINAVTAVLSASSGVFNTATGRLATPQESFKFQQFRAKQIQTAARSALAEVGIAGEPESILVQSLVSGLGQRGLQFGAQDIATLAQRLGSTIQLVNPGILQNESQLRRDILDITLGLPQARRTSVGAILGEEGVKAFAKSGDIGEILKRTNRLEAFSDILKNRENANAPVLLQTIQSEISVITQNIGNALLEGLLPALRELANVLSDPSTLKGVEDFARGMGQLVSGLVQAASAIGKLFSILGLSGKSNENVSVEKQRADAALSLSNPFAGPLGAFGGVGDVIGQFRFLSGLGRFGRIEQERKEAEEAARIGANNKAFQGVGDFTKATLAQLGISSEEARVGIFENVGPEVALGRLNRAIGGLPSRQLRQGETELTRQLAEAKLKDVRAGQGTEAFQELQKGILEGTPLGEATRLQEKSRLVDANQVEAALANLRAAFSSLKDVAKTGDDVADEIARLEQAETNLLAARKEQISTVLSAIEAEKKRTEALVSTLDTFTFAGQKLALGERVRSARDIQTVAGGRLSEIGTNISNLQDQLKTATGPDKDRLERDLTQQQQSREAFLLQRGQALVSQRGAEREQQILPFQEAGANIQLEQNIRSLADSTQNAQLAFDQLADSVKGAQRSIEDFSNETELRSLEREDQLSALAQQISAKGGRVPLEALTDDNLKNQLAFEGPEFSGGDQSREARQVRILQERFKSLSRRADPKRVAEEEAATGRRLESGLKEAQIAERDFPLKLAEQQNNLKESIVQLQQKFADTPNILNQFEGSILKTNAALGSLTTAFETAAIKITELVGGGKKSPDSKDTSPEDKNKDLRIKPHKKGSEESSTPNRFTGAFADFDVSAAKGLKNLPIDGSVIKDDQELIPVEGFGGAKKAAEAVSSVVPSTENLPSQTPLLASQTPTLDLQEFKATETIVPEKLSDPLGLKGLDTSGKPFLGESEQFTPVKMFGKKLTPAQEAEMDNFKGFARGGFKGVGDGSFTIDDKTFNKAGRQIPNLKDLGDFGGDATKGLGTTLTALGEQATKAGEGLKKTADATTKEIAQSSGGASDKDSQTAQAMDRIVAALSTIGQQVESGTRSAYS